MNNFEISNASNHSKTENSSSKYPNFVIIDKFEISSAASPINLKKSNNNSFNPKILKYSAKETIRELLYDTATAILELFISIVIFLVIFSVLFLILFLIYLLYSYIREAFPFCDRILYAVVRCLRFVR